MAMATGKISKRTVDATTAQDRDEFLWDSELRGFGLKATINGAKSYLIQYRMGGRDTPTRRYTLGAHGSPWTPTKAREEAERLLQLVKSGIDPREAARERQRSVTDLAFDCYSERYLENYGRRHWRARTYANVESNLRRYALPVLRKRALPTITRADITTVFDALPKDKPALPRNLFAHLRKLFAWAVERGDIGRSPFEGLRSPPAVASRERVLTDEEVKLVWSAAGTLGFPFGPMVRMLIATGQRRDEVAAMDWRELDRAVAEWTIRAGRAKNGKTHTVPLNGLATAVLDELAGGKSWPSSGLILSTTGTSAASGFSRAKRRLDRILLELRRQSAEEAGDQQPLAMVPWRLHDLRRTMATGLQRLGVRFEVTEAVLNHVSGSRAGVAGVYQRHHWTDEKREALTKWSEHVQQLVSPRPQLRVV